MVWTILKQLKDNDYYVEGEDGIIRGSFHSVADAEMAINTKKTLRTSDSQSLLDYVLIKEYVRPFDRH